MSGETLRQHARDYLDAPEWTNAPPGPDEVSRFYDRNAAVLATLMGGSTHHGYWTGPADTAGLPQASALLTTVVAARLGVRPGDHVLDLGCGSGRPALQVAGELGVRVTGVCLSAAELAQAEAAAAAEGATEQVRFVRADAVELPFPAASFEAVMSIEALVHIPDRERVLGQVARVLRQGGRLALVDHCLLLSEAEEAEDPGALYALAEVMKAWRMVMPVRPQEYRALAPRVGLVVDETVDLTGHTSRTSEHLYAALREYAAAQPLPPDLARIYELGADLDWDEIDDEPATDGLALVVAHRP